MKNKVEKMSRTPWQRILHIHERLRAGEYPNCVVLAPQLEVSPKTLKRDIEFMRGNLDLPIEYDSKRHGYFYSKPVDRFPGVAMTEQEMFALLVADKAIAQFHGTPFQKPLRMAFEKMTGQLDSGAKYSLEGLNEALSFRPFGASKASTPLLNGTDTFQTVARALQDRRALKFMYRNLGTKVVKERLVHPYHLACIDSCWYLFAYDVDRAAIRTFLLARLTDPAMTEERFEKPKDFNADEYLRGSLTVLKGEADYEVLIELDIWAADLMRGRQWHSSQEFIELPNGCAHLRMRLSSLDEIERWVLNWGDHATVLRPEKLRERVWETAISVAGKYKGN